MELIETFRHGYKSTHQNQASLVQQEYYEMNRNDKIFFLLTRFLGDGVAGLLLGFILMRLMESLTIYIKNIWREKVRNQRARKSKQDSWKELTSKFPSLGGP